MNRSPRDAGSRETDGAADAGLPQRWHDLSIQEALETAGSGPEGLSSDEATERLRRYGPNRIEVEKEEPWWLLLARQLRDPLVYILLSAHT